MLKVEDLRGKAHIVLCTPCYGGQVFQNYFLSVIKLLLATQKHGVRLSFIIRGGDSLIPRTRNSIVAEFLTIEDATHLFWVDADIGFDPSAVFRLLCADRDVVAGIYPLKKINFPPVIPKDMTRQEFDAHYTRYPFNPISKTFKIDTDGFVEVLDAPTGFMMIKRGVFTKMIEKYPDLKITADIMPGLEHIREKIKDLEYRFFDVMTEENGRYLSEDYAFCLDSQTRVETEDGVKTIKWIVDNKYTGKVASFDENGKLVFKHVTAHWSRRNGKRGNPEKTWVKINTQTDNNTKAKLRCTSDHRVAVFDDVFDPKIYYVPAIEAVGKYVVKMPDHVRKLHKNNALFNKDQISAIVGSLMGDAYIGQHKQLAISHSVKQREYAMHMQQILGGKTDEFYQSESSFKPKQKMIRLTLPVNAQTRVFRDMIYAGKKTCLPLLKHIDEIALAYWYMDDGTLGTNGNPSLCTYGFSFAEHEEIVNMFKTRFGIDASIHTVKNTYKGKDRTYHSIYIPARSKKAFFDLVAPYVIPSMRYKLPEKYSSVPMKQLNTQCLDFSASLVISVQKITRFSKLYDIEVDETHNFIANDTLVHNCRRWQKIGGKIYADVASNLSHQGGHVFTGNFGESLKLNIVPKATPNTNTIVSDVPPSPNSP